MKKGFRISFNAPVTLVFAILSALILLLDMPFMLKGKLIPALFMVPGNQHSPSPFIWTNALSYIRLFTHVLGHTDWPHYLANFSFILLLGPMMEEKYGSPMLLLMMTITSLITGLINATFLTTSLTGASGIAFMLIVLASINTIYKNELPASFLGVLAVFIIKEIISPSGSNVSSIAHIAGGLCGSLFGIVVAPKASRIEKATVTKPKKPAGRSSNDEDFDDRLYTKRMTAAEKLARIKQLDSQSPRKGSHADDETVEIGTIKL